MKTNKERNKERQTVKFAKLNQISLETFKTLRIFHKMIRRCKKSFGLLWTFFLVTFRNICESIFL